MSPSSNIAPAAALAIVAKAITYSGRGGEEVIVIAERTVRTPRDGEVRIRVVAAAVNPADILLRDPGRGDLPLPMTPGMDAAGVVEALGPNVTRLAVGDAVMAAVSPQRAEGGAQAAYIVVPAASVVRKPSGATLVEAATLPMNALTALYALDLAALSAGQTLAVSGGAGLLARYAIAIARQRGLRVVADAKVEEVALVRGYGADVVVAREELFAQAVRRAVPQGADALLDTAVLGEQAFAALRDGGVYIPVRGWSNRPTDARILIRPVMVSAVLERTDWLEEVRALAEAGTLVPSVGGEYAPEQIVQAQRLLKAGGLRGRPVIVF